jgi:hypothetical protein
MSPPGRINMPAARAFEKGAVRSVNLSEEEIRSGRYRIAACTLALALGNSEAGLAG